MVVNAASSSHSITSWRIRTTFARLDAGDRLTTFACHRGTYDLGLVTEVVTEAPVKHGFQGYPVDST